MTELSLGWVNRHQTPHCLSSISRQYSPPTGCEVSPLGACRGFLGDLTYCRTDQVHEVKSGSAVTQRQSPATSPLRNLSAPGPALL